jgi:hypothetical protein
MEKCGKDTGQSVQSSYTDNGRPNILGKHDKSVVCKMGRNLVLVKDTGYVLAVCG